MCGIFGYIGKQNPLERCLEGLEFLEYRGYDSTGIAGIANGSLRFCKVPGTVSFLRSQIPKYPLEIAIGHTRWATHGKVNYENAHPQFDTQKQIALVHNGIIENYQLLKDRLKQQGAVFSSDTDSEVIVQLIARAYQGDFLKAFQAALDQLTGHFALAAIHQNHPDQILAAARQCPLSIGWNAETAETFLSSDPNALLGKAQEVFFLKDGEIARVLQEKTETFSASLLPITKGTQRLFGEGKSPSKEGFEHFMLKEIYEQPLTVQKASYLQIDEERVFWNLSLDLLQKVEHIYFIGCGTSAHAGAIGALFFEQFASLSTRTEIASEAKYRMDAIPKNTLVVAISQSGETADTLAALEEAKKRHLPLLGICNAPHCALTREVDGCLFLQAGMERSVCSTKAFTSQITLLAWLSLYFAKIQKKTSPQADLFAQELQKLPSLIQRVLYSSSEIEKLAQKYSHFEHFFFLGRHYMYPTCMEAALKLKEISYIDANGYPGGELKHGPIALLSAQFPVLAFCSNRLTQKKILNNLMEVKSRGAPTLAFAPESLREILEIADDTLFLPDVIDPIAPFVSGIAGQLFAYFIAKQRGCNIDQPRNLAKSVTVE